MDIGMIFLIEIFYPSRVMCLPPTQVCPPRLDFNLSLPYYIIMCTWWCAWLCIRLKGVQQGTFTLWIFRFQEKNLTNFDYLSYNVNKANNWWPLSFLILLSVFKIMIHGPNCEISFEPEGRLCCSHSPHLKISPGLHWSCWRQRQGSDRVDLGIGRSTRPL